jgi:hypothetical protein
MVDHGGNGFFCQVFRCHFSFSPLDRQAAVFFCEKQYSTELESWV